MIENERKTIFNGLMKEWLDPPYIPVIAFGGAGAHFLRSFENLLIKYKNTYGPENYSNIFTFYVNTKQETDLESYPFVKTVLITNSVLGVHNDTEGFVEVGEKLINENFEEIFESMSGKIQINLKKADAIILVAALGGGMGTGGIKEALRLMSIKYPNIPIFPILVMPFNFENRSISTRKEIDEILKINKKPTVIKNSEFIHFENDKKMKFADLLEKINFSVAEKIMDIVELVRHEREEVFQDLYGKIFNEEFDRAISLELYNGLKPL